MPAVEEGSTVPALGHQWDNGTPGENSTIIFTCLRCNETYKEIKSDSDNVWFSNDGYGVIKLNWTAVSNLSDDTYYSINGKNTYGQSTSTSSFSQLLGILGAEQNADIEIGTLSNELITPVYKLADAWNIQQLESTYDIGLELVSEFYSITLSGDTPMGAYCVATVGGYTSATQGACTLYSAQPGDKVTVVIVTEVTCSEPIDGKSSSITLHCTKPITLTIPEA